MIQKGEHEWHVLFSYHHLILDGWSVGILMNRFFQELQQVYAGNKLPDVKDQDFIQYTQWVRDKGGEISSRNYWQAYLKDADGIAEMLPDKTQIDLGYAAAGQKIKLTPALHAKLKATLQNGHFTMNSLLMASWGLVTGKYLNSNDITLGYVVSGREEGLKAPEEAIGLFINTLPLRMQWDAETTFENLLQQVDTDLVTARDHQWTSLGELSRLLSGSAELIRQILVFENYPLDSTLMDIQPSNGESSWQVIPASIKVFDQTHYSFYANVFEDDGLELQIKYDGNKYSNELVLVIKKKLRKIHTSGM
jgi:hypothetical protein